MKAQNPQSTITDQHANNNNTGECDFMECVKNIYFQKKCVPVNI